LQVARDSRAAAISACKVRANVYPALPRAGIGRLECGVGGRGLPQRRAAGDHGGTVEDVVAPGQGKGREQQRSVDQAGPPDVGVLPT